MTLKQEITFAVIKKNGVVAHIGRTEILLPRIRFSGGGINWFDDSRLVRGKKNE